MGFEPMMPTLKVWCLTTWPRSDNTMQVHNRNDMVAAAVFTFQCGIGQSDGIRTLDPALSARCSAN